ncbi:MAG: Nif11-like leader peptide family natural product precursor [Cyanobacteria bacterium J06634_5]
MKALVGVKQFPSQFPQCFCLLSTAAKDEQLKAKLGNTASPDELINVAKQTGYEFSSEHVDEALDELKQRPVFFACRRCAGDFWPAR